MIWSFDKGCIEEVDNESVLETSYLTLFSTSFSASSVASSFRLAAVLYVDSVADTLVKDKLVRLTFVEASLCCFSNNFKTKFDHFLLFDSCFNVSNFQVQSGLNTQQSSF